MADKLTRKQFAAKIKEKYPQYAGVPDDKLVDTIVAKYPQYGNSIMDLKMTPPGEISTGPHGMDAVKAALYRGGDFVTNNLDTAGGIVGGVAGTAAGGPAGGVVGATLGGGAGRAATQLINTIRGKPMESSSAAAGDIALGGAEQGLMELGGVVIGKLGKALKPVGREAYLAYGAKAGELAPQIQKVMPDLDKMASRVGKPKSVGEFENLVHATERGFNQEFNAALFPIAQQPTAAHSVAQAIRGQITPNLAKTSEGQSMARYLNKRAMEFDQGTWTIGELNRERELISKRLKAYHNAIASGQSAQARVHANIAADTAAEGALKDMLYNAADQSGVKPPGYFKALKQKQSDLISLRDAVSATKEKLTKASTERAGAPLSDKIHVKGFMHPTSGATAAAGASPSLFTDPLKQADSAIGKGFPSTTKSAIRGVRNVAGTAISNPDVNALPIRALFGDYSEPQQEAPK
jgi:hypothetical protein